MPQENDVSASIEDGVSEIPGPCANPAFFSRNLGELFRQHVSKDPFSHIIKEKGLRALQKPKGATNLKIVPTPFPPQKKQLAKISIGFLPS